MNTPPQSRQALQDDSAIIEVFRTAEEEPPPLLLKQFSQSLAKNVEERLHRSECRLRWVVPVSLLTGIIVGSLVAALALTQLPAIPQMNPQKIPVIFQDSNQAQVRAQQDPRLWLSYISELILDNKIDLAQHELAAFRQQFPEFTER